MKKEIPVYNWDDIPSRELKPGIFQRGFRSDGVMVTYNYLEPGCKGSAHSHPFDQIFMVIKGRVTLHVEEQTIECVPGTIVRIPAHYVHYVDPPSAADGTAITVDISGPARKDYLNIVSYQTDDFAK